MIITWYGEGCFKIQNGDDVVLTDAPPKDSGIVAPRITPLVYIQTIGAWQGAAGPSVQERATFVINGAGEYDIHGIKIKGFQLAEESSPKFFKTIYTVLWDTIALGLLGHLSGDISPATLESFEELDVLMGPGSGSPFIAQDKIAKLVKQLNPKIFIPSFVATKGLVRKAAPVKELVTQFNGDAESADEKFVFKKKDLDAIKKTKIVCLHP